MDSAHAKADLPRAERESRTNTVLSPHSAGTLSSDHLVRSFIEATKAFGVALSCVPTIL